MAMVDAKVNFNFEESFVEVDKVLVTNNLGRTAIHLELVALDGYFGEVRDFDGILDGETGYININPRREVRTTQINISDTFVVGGIVHLISDGSLVTSVLRSTPETDAVPVGICAFVNAGVAIGFVPFAQRSGGVNDMKVSVYEVDSDHSTLVVVTGLVPLGARIYDVIVECTVTNALGTLQLRSNNASPVAITAALVCAVDNVVSRQAILTNNVVDADGLEVIANGAADRGIMVIYWR